YSLDATQWSLLIALSIAIAEVIVATALTNPSIQVHSIVNQSTFLTLSLNILALDVGSWLSMRAHFRVSSVVKGEVLRPGLYTMAEDVIAVDACCGTQFRGRLNERRKASPCFRSLFQKLSFLWTLSGAVVNGACLVISIVAIAIMDGRGDVGFVIGFTIPYIWILVLIPVSVPMTRRNLRKEKVQLSVGFTTRQEEWC
ncbi:hypothetical protein BGW36DRAFT_306898, partial [Talaromyces proteolyticus]